MDLCSCCPRRIFSRYFLWQSILLSYIFKGTFGRHFVSSLWLLGRMFSLIFFYTDILVFSFLWDWKSTMLSPVIHLYMFSELPCHRPWLFNLWILSYLSLFSDCLRDLMVSFLLVPHVTFRSLLSLDCTIVFLVLLVASQCLCRSPILWCYDRVVRIPDMSMVVRTHLLLGVRDSIMFSRQFLPSGPWLRRTTSSTSRLRLRSKLRYVAALAGACCLIWTYDIQSSIGSLNWQYWLMT